LAAGDGPVSGVGEGEAGAGALDGGAAAEEGEADQDQDEVLNAGHVDIGAQDVGDSTAERGRRGEALAP
jgi:hypothetical protein